MSELERGALEVDMDKDILLQELKRSIHFEKKVAASNAANYIGPNTMHLPTWFVAQHGDTFRKSVLLRCGRSTEPWLVKIQVCGALSYVKFGSGWRDFSVDNNLAVGDTLIFSLRTLSEFDVYIIRATGAPRKRSRHAFELPKASKTIRRTRQNVAAERSADREVSETEVRRGRRVKEMSVRDRQEKISFKVTLTATAASSRCRLTLPRAFVKQHGDKMQTDVVLHTVADRRTWTVKVHIYFPTHTVEQFVFDGYGWKAFVVSNGLVEGDQLTFNLVAMSKFDVLILRTGGCPKEVRPSVQGRRLQRSKSSTLSQTSQLAKHLGPQQIDLTGQRSKKMGRRLSSKHFAETEDDEESDAVHSYL